MLIFYVNELGGHNVKIYSKNAVLKHSTVVLDGYEQKTVDTQQLRLLNLLCSF
jgi:hypothetical protein